MSEPRGLGRLVEHDPRSRGYRAPKAAVLRSVRHVRSVPVTDQGSLGSCTGHAMVSAVASDGRTVPWWFDLDTPGAERIYSKATHVDRFAGEWPPEDTGSSGLAACKAAKSFGLISGYSWAFGLEEVLAALVLRPVMIGIDWWSSFDEPDPDGRISIRPGATVRGGHEICLDEIDAEHGRVWFTNSWGDGWAHKGRAWMSWATLGQLLRDGGDAVVPVPRGAASWWERIRAWLGLG